MSLPIDGAKPHFYIAVCRSKERRATEELLSLFDIPPPNLNPWPESIHPSVLPVGSPLRSQARKMVTFSVPLQACRGQQLEARLGMFEPQFGSLGDFFTALSSKYSSMAAFIPVFCV